MLGHVTYYSNSPTHLHISTTRSPSSRLGILPESRINFRFVKLSFNREGGLSSTRYSPHPSIVYFLFLIPPPPLTFTLGTRASLHLNGGRASWQASTVDIRLISILMDDALECRIGPISPHRARRYSRRADHQAWPTILTAI